MGTNKLIGSDPDRLLQEASVLLDSTGAYKNGHAPVCPPLWDGRTAARIVDVLKGYLWGRRKTEERAIAVS
jgi:UDP-N-acetylglucosamine 2-epimerase